MKRWRIICIHPERCLQSARILDNPTFLHVKPVSVRPSVNIRNQASSHSTPQPHDHQDPPPLGAALRLILLVVLGGTLAGCPPDNTPLLKENEELTKQVTKQDSMLTTLQEGNRVLQEQINRLNQELREKESLLTQQLDTVKEAGRTLTADNHNLTQQTAQLSKEKVQLTQANLKLQRDNDWLRRQREIFRQSLQINLTDARSQTLAVPIHAAVSASSQALTQHGYTLLGKMATDKEALFITERKTSISPSIELPGFRNQYVVGLKATNGKQTTLSVKAYYEKLSGAGKILEVGPGEVTEIERRLIQAIEQTLKGPAQKP